MNAQENVQIVKDAFAAFGRGNMALFAEDIEWIIPGEWPLAGTHRGHAGLADFLQKASETVETSISEPREFVSQGDRVLVLGFATGRVKATNRNFEDHFVFAVIVRCQTARNRDPQSASKKDPSIMAGWACPGSEQEGPARPRSAFQRRWRSGRVGGACLPIWASRG